MNDGYLQLDICIFYMALLIFLPLQVSYYYALIKVY